MTVDDFEGAVPAPGSHFACVAWAGEPGTHGQLIDRRSMELHPRLREVGTSGEQIWYLSTAMSGGPCVVSGYVLRPRGHAPDGGWPVIAWGAGGFGLADKCAPSRHVDLTPAAGHGEYAAFLAKLLEGGFAVASSDYEGLGTPGVRPFQAPYSEGRSVLDAVLAARAAYSDLEPRYFAIGHSGGGHAALDTAEVAATGYGHDLDFLGTVALEPAGDFTYLPEEPVPTTGLLAPQGRGIYLAIIVGLKSQHPDLRLTDYLGPDAIQRLEIIYHECSVTVAEAYADVPASQFAPRTAAARERLREWLRANAVPRRATGKPVFFPTGATQADLPVVRRCHSRAWALGDPVLRRIYPNTDHRQLLLESVEHVLTWLRDRLSGLAPPVGTDE